jgi:peptide/nickel transport system permease protein
MQGYVFRRLGWAVPTLLLVSVWIFVLIHLIPGDVIISKMASAGTIPKANLDAVRHQLGIDRPLPVQYLSWLGGVLHFDAGKSLYFSRPVADLIKDAFPVTIELAVFTMCFAIGIGVPLGVLSAVYHDTKLDHAVRVFSVGGQALPDFWNAIIVILVLSRFFGYLPSIYYAPLWKDPWTNLQQMLLPAAVLGYRMSSSTMRMTRSSLLEVLRQDYIRTASAKGLGRARVIGRHALRNSSIPVITDIGTQFSFLLGGTVVLESLFGIPGLGLLSLQAVLHRDYPLVQGTVLFLGAIIVLSNLTIDTLYGAIDPRMRLRA